MGSNRVLFEGRRKDSANFVAFREEDLESFNVLFLRHRYHPRRDLLIGLENHFTSSGIDHIGGCKSTLKLDSRDFD